MKTIILAGGYGTRLGEYTDLIPKPMVKIGNKPILFHIMEHYASYGFDDFYVALGYKAEVIKDYFLNYKLLNSDFLIELSSGSVREIKSPDLNWKVTLVDTGVDTLTGGRLKRLSQLIGNETFMITYGDGLSNIDLSALLNFHRSHGKMVTVSAVRPTARFGELDLEGHQVSKFQEKPQLAEGWINGGFIVAEPKFLDLIEGDEIMMEREPFEAASRLGELMAYKHEDFWHCMDTKRDHEFLEKKWEEGAPWVRRTQ
jgi:glucose-1-phosphate cytidylyltransferase